MFRIVSKNTECGNIVYHIVFAGFFIILGRNYEKNMKKIRKMLHSVLLQNVVTVLSMLES